MSREPGADRARAAILARIRAATADVPRDERPQDVGVERDYRHELGEPRDVLVARFAERVADYKARVRRVAGAELAGTLAEACRERGARRLVVPADLPEAWRPAGVELMPDQALPIGVLDGMDGVLTGCALGIAETGTLVLDGGPGQGRRAISLLPDYHLCVIAEDQVVGGVPEAMAALREAVREEHRPVTFISGPSATSDIELSRVEGVHGPRTLEVVVVGGG